MGYSDWKREQGARCFKKNSRERRLERKRGNIARHFTTLDEVLAFEHGLSRKYREIIRPADPPELLIDVVGQINAEILRHLKRVPSDVHRLSPRQFEELIAEILASYGWSVKLTPATKDGGYDIFAINKNAPGLEHAWLVECKKYRDDRPVGVEVVRSFWAVKADLWVPNGLIATTSYFTKGALQFKESRYDLALKDFESIVEWINLYRPHPEGKIYLKENSSLTEGDLLALPGQKRSRIPAPNSSTAPDANRVTRGRRR